MNMYWQLSEEGVFKLLLVQKHVLKMHDIGPPAEAFVGFVSVASERRYHELRAEMMRIERPG